MQFQENKWSGKSVFVNDMESGCLWQAAKTKNTVFLAPIIVLKKGHIQC